MYKHSSISNFFERVQDGLGRIVIIPHVQVVLVHIKRSDVLVGPV